MDLERVFNLCGLLAMAGWIALAVAPLAHAPLIRAARIVSGLLAVAYAVQMATITQPVQGGSFLTLGGVAALFSMPGNVMLGWTHYLAFDLFTGAWEAEDGARIGIAHWALLVPLFLTLMVGPIGLLTYGVIRTLHLWRTRGRWV